MSKTSKAVLFCVYCAFFVQILLSIISKQNEIVSIKYLIRTQGSLKKINHDVKKMRRNLTMDILKDLLSHPYERPKRYTTDLKFILKWTKAFSHYSSSIYKNGQTPFFDSNCSYYNCFLTNDKSILTDLRHFDAILFDVENNWDLYPHLRALHQKYIFTASESADNYPICDDSYNYFFNWTWTYRLDSDIRLSYITVLDNHGDVVGPKIDMIWKNLVGELIPVTIKKKLISKEKAGAWFVSNCNPKSKRQNIVNDIRHELNKFGYDIDIYGWCGEYSCPKDNIEDCLNLLENKYYFYFAFENSMCADYVTEKILYPLKHYTVPVVYGGANYSRFLAPGSYIDAGIIKPITVAKKMVDAIQNRSLYEDYFRWHNHYQYTKTSKETDLCSLCKKLNVDSGFSVVSNLGKWWNEDFELNCKETKPIDKAMAFK